MNKEQKLSVLLGLFVSAIIAANFLGTKITTILGISFSVGAFSYPFTFLITDIVEDVYGWERTKQFIYSAFVAVIFVMLLTILSLSLPVASRFEMNDAYVSLFSISIRIFIASIVSFLFAQFHDLWAFDIIKKQTHGKYLWLRNNVSTIASQFIDTTLFMFIAFYHVSPKFTVPFIFSHIIPYWSFKVLFALVDTPFVYLGVWWLKKK